MNKIVLQDQQLNQLVGSVTNELLDGKSFPGGAVTGDAIVGFSKHTQVNNFVLFQIYQDWNAQMQKMQHPYFDYSAQEVKDGLRTFLNLLSRHIRVPLADFQKMLRQAVYNTLKLILNPEDAFSNFFFQNSQAIPIDLFRQHSVYFKDFDFVVQSLQKFFAKNGVQRVEKTVFLEKFHKVIQIFEKKNGKEIYAYQKALFHDLTGMDLDLQVAQAKAAARPPVKPVVQPEAKTVVPAAKKEEEAKEDLPDWIRQERERRQGAQGGEREKTVSDLHREAKSEKKSINDMFTSGKEEQQAEPAKEEPRRKVTSLLSREPKKPEPKEQAPAQESKPQTEEPSEADKPKKSTIDLFAQAKKAESAMKDKKTVAETLGTTPDQGKGNLNQALGSKMIRTEQIPVHKQFQFVQKVFGGSSVKFKVVLDKINKTESLEEAESVMNRYVFNDPSVNRNDKVCKEFVALVRGRFEG